jgi:hypothetical protein
MQFSFDISSSGLPEKKADSTPAAEITPTQMLVGILQQMLDSQRQAHLEILGVLREHLNHARAVHQENLARWKTILGRWEKDYPELPANARKIYPVMERAYLDMLNRLASDLADEGDEALDTEFSLQDFLDRNGMKIGQFGHLLSVIGPISEVGNQIAAENEKK